MEIALTWQQAGTALPFVTRQNESGKVVGSTRMANIEKVHRRLEIGWSWITPEFQRTSVNTEAKYLMLKHAFETIDVMRVEFRVDETNAKSRAALKRIGVTEEGILRKHLFFFGGRITNIVYHSILDEEWPGVKANLEMMIERKGT